MPRSTDQTVEAGLPIVGQIPYLRSSANQAAGEGIVDALCNEMGITIPVAIHADHYGIKNDKELEAAKGV